MAIGLARPDRRQRFRKSALHMGADAGHLVGRVIIVRQKGEGDGHRLPAPDAVPHLILEDLELAPIAAAHLLVQKGARQVGKRGLQGPGGPVGLHRLGMTLQG